MPVFHRLLTRRALLYTEMLTTGAVLHGDRARLLRFDPAEHPVALQLGGADPRALAAGARIGEDLGYDEINLNVGCPSDRVQSGRFGACLMAEPALVADCVAAMKAAVAIPVTVKCRIGIDEQDPEAGARRLRAARSNGRRRRASSCMRARPGSRACRRRRTATSRRSTMTASIGSKRRIRDLTVVINGGIGTSRRRRRISITSTASCWAAPPIRSRGGCSLSIRELFGEAAPLFVAEGRGGRAHPLYRARTGARAPGCTR